MNSRSSTLAILSLAMLASAAPAQEAQTTTGGPPFRKGQIGVEFVQVGNGGGELRLEQGVGFQWFRSPTAAWDLHIRGYVGGGSSEDRPDSLEENWHSVTVSLGRRHYHRVSDRAATFQAFGIQGQRSWNKVEQYGTSSEGSYNSAGVYGGLGANVWATSWLAFGAQYRATASYAWSSGKTSDQLGNTVESSWASWHVSLDGLTVNGSLFF